MKVRICLWTVWMIAIGALWFAAHRAKETKEGEARAIATSTCNQIHEPKSGCPAGFVREKTPRFTEKDGSHQFACVTADAEKQDCMDYLAPGEGVEMEFQVPLDVEPRSSPSTNSQQTRTQP